MTKFIRYIYFFKNIHKLLYVFEISQLILEQFVLRAVNMAKARSTPVWSLPTTKNYFVQRSIYFFLDISAKQKEKKRQV
jgi:hypothetical protein